MKQLAYIYFIAYFLIASVADADMHELLKISNLVEHFQEHFKTKPDSTVLGLLEMHYASDRNSEEHHKKDHDRHTGNLPFQSHSCCHSVTVYLASSFYGVDFNSFSFDRPFISFYRVNIPPILSRSIWQPPKLSV